MASHVSQCMAKAYACRTHGMPCVNMHGSFEDYIRGFSWAIRTSKGEHQEEGGGREKRKGEREKGKEKGRKGKERGRRRKEKERRKEKKKNEEERKKKEEKEGVSHSEQTRMAKNPELRYKR